MIARIRPVEAADSDWIRNFTADHWGSEFVIVHETVYYPHRLPGFVAEDPNAQIAGLATYCMDADSCELVTLNAISRGRGTGTALLNAVAAAAESAGCKRLWLVTTNDNVGALAFYLKRGMRITAVDRDAVVRSRREKPSIPLIGEHGIPICDELTLEMPLGRAPGPCGSHFS